MSIDMNLINDHGSIFSLLNAIIMASRDGLENCNIRPSDFFTCMTFFELKGRRLLGLLLKRRLLQFLGHIFRCVFLLRKLGICIRSTIDCLVGSRGFLRRIVRLLGCRSGMTLPGLSLQLLDLFLCLFNILR